MALRVWLPLNGNLENKGIGGDISFSLTSGNSFTPDGKTGDGLKLTKLQQILNTSSCMTGAKEVSYAFWVKVNTAWSANWLDGIRWISTDGSSTSTERQEFYTNCTYIGTWYKGGAISGKSFTPGVWTHLAATINYNTGQSCFYINGILQGSASNVDTTYYCRGDFYIGDNGVDILENDVRIYDHCLSQKEVKEISQGLVLHYKLDGFSGGVGENLVRGSNSNTILTNKWLGHSAIGGNVSTIEQDETGTYCVKITRDATEQSSWDYLSYDNFLRDRIKTDTEYTISFDCKPSVNGSIGFTGFVNGNATNYMTNSTTVIQGNCTANQWNHMIYKCKTINSFDAITVSGQVVYFSRSASLKGTNVTILFKNIKVEEGSIATSWSPALEDLGINTAKIVDSSGYENHSYPYGIYFISEQGPRYNVVADFSGEGSSSSAELSMSMSKGNTIAFWCSAPDWSEYNLDGAVCQGSNWSITSYNNNLILKLVSYISAENSNYNLAQDYTWILMPTSSLGTDWHYFVLTYLNHEIKFYLDGILYKTINNISTDIADYFYTNYLTLASLPIS